MLNNSVHKIIEFWDMTVCEKLSEILMSQIFFVCNVSIADLLPLHMWVVPHYTSHHRRIYERVCPHDRSYVPLNTSSLSGKHMLRSPTPCRILGNYIFKSTKSQLYAKNEGSLQRIRWWFPTAKEHEWDKDKAWVPKFYLLFSDE